MDYRQRKEAAKRLLEYACSVERNTLIPHKQIETIVGVRQKTPDYDFIMMEAEKMCGTKSGEYPIRLYRRLDWGQGVRVLSGHDQTSKVPLLEMRRVLRKLGREQRYVEAVPADELSDHQRRNQAVVADTIGEARKGVRRAIKETSQFFKRRESKPQIGQA